MYTAISHTTRYNYQGDFDNVQQFIEWCESTKAIWAHLFDIATAQMIATYHDKQGTTNVV